MRAPICSAPARSCVGGTHLAPGESFFNGFILTISILKRLVSFSYCLQRARAWAAVFVRGDEGARIALLPTAALLAVRGPDGRAPLLVATRALAALAIDSSVDQRRLRDAFSLIRMLALNGARINARSTIGWTGMNLI